MGSERGDEFKKPCSLGEGTGSKESDNGEAPHWATASRLVPTHQIDPPLSEDDKRQFGYSRTVAAKKMWRSDRLATISRGNSRR